MNLKDAFRAQNKLQTLMDEASYILQDQGNTLKVTTTHLRSKEGKNTTTATTYIAGGKPVMNLQRDDFIRKHVSQRRIQTSSSSSGSRSGGGYGGAHHSSGGHSHGGGSHRR